MGLFQRLRGSDLARHGAIVFGAVVITNVFNYLFYMLIGRRGGVETYGIVTSLTSAVLVVSALATVAQLVAARLAADLSVRGDRSALRELADVVTRWASVVGCVVAIACVLLRDQLAAFFNLPNDTPVVVAAVSLGLMMVVIPLRGLFQGAHRFEDFSVSMLIDSTVRVAVGVPLVGVWGAAGALLGTVASLGLALTYSLAACRARFGKVRSALALDRRLIRRVISHVGLGQFTFTILMFYDVPLIKHAFDAHAAGLYAAAALVGRAVVAATSFIPTLVMPKATARAASGASPLPLLWAALGVAAMVGLVAALAGVVAPRFVVTVIAGQAFGESAPLVLPYILASSALSLGNVVAAYKMGLHRYEFVVPVVIVAALEIGTLSAWHPTLAAAISVLAVGHIAIFGATLYRLDAPVAIGVGLPAASGVLGIEPTANVGQRRA
jgi:O-antigen/teichoic acid export membrane protein